MARRLVVPAGSQERERWYGKMARLSVSMPPVDAGAFVCKVLRATYAAGVAAGRQAQAASCGDGACPPYDPPPREEGGGDAR